MAQVAILPNKGALDETDVRRALSYYLIATLANAADSPMPIEAGSPLTFHVLGDGDQYDDQHMLLLLQEADVDSGVTVRELSTDYAWFEFHEVRMSPTSSLHGRIYRERSDLTDATAAAWTPGTLSVPITDPSWNWPPVANPDAGDPGEPATIPMDQHPDFDIDDVLLYLSFYSPFASGKSDTYDYEYSDFITGYDCVLNDEHANIWVEVIPGAGGDPPTYQQVTFVRWHMWNDDPKDGASETRWTYAWRSIASPASHDPLTAPTTTGSWTLESPFDIGDFDHADPTIEPRISSHFLAFWAWQTVEDEVAAGTWREWLGITEENFSAPVVKRYADGSEAADGTIPARRAYLTPDAFSMPTKTAWFSVPPAMPDYPGSTLYSIDGFQGRSRGGAWIPAALGGETAGGTTVPWGAVNAQISGAGTDEQSTLGVYLFTDGVNLVEVGIALRAVPNDGDAPYLKAIYYRDWMVLTGYDVFLGNVPAGFLEPVQPSPSFPAGGLAAYHGDYEDDALFWPAPDARLAFNAIRSDDGDMHDDRANTAVASIAAYLAGGTGLVYDGPFGQLPRPYSGATGTMLGREITATASFTFDAVTRPDGIIVAALVWGDATGLVWEAVEEEGSWVATDVWSGPVADALPPDVWAEFATPLPPVLTYRFLLPDWPHPTGVLSVAGVHTIFAARDRKNDRKYRTPGGRPPIVTSFGWRYD